MTISRATRIGPWLTGEDLHAMANRVTAEVASVQAMCHEMFIAILCSEPHVAEMIEFQNVPLRLHPELKDLLDSMRGLAQRLSSAVRMAWTPSRIRGLIFCD